jgi:hypothetical protein
VSPSPRELFDQLSDDEKVAIDLISELGAEEDALQDMRLRTLVPSEGRRGYLRTLAKQLPTCVGDVGLDDEAATWAAARARVDAAALEAARERMAAQDRDRTWLETLTSEARRSVERQRHSTEVSAPR